ncbi:unnamed protein product [Symbiodinium pilosum]|uniref:Uncharacterized protein n=1 Tax=Symbiodinium pilosum TaxID=2952 RepID=A0A812W3K9_SYMPI|nr:unnamed protein product [Symbiodinium pilosum]
MRCSNCVASESNKCLLCGGLFGSKGLGSYSYWQAWQAGPPNRSCKQLSLEQGWHCSADDPIPDKVGVQVRLTKQEKLALKKLECSMCKAVISEMHMEVSRHSMTEQGAGSEEQIWETSNAMCLALLQKYRLNLDGEPSLDAKQDEDDETAMAAAAAQGKQDNFMRSMLVFKMGCQQWLEDYGSDTSGYVYKSVKERVQSPAGAAQEFCVRSVKLCGKGAKGKKKQEKAEKERLAQRTKMAQNEEAAEEKRKKDDPMSSLPDDSKFGIQRLLEMARDDPLHYMDEATKGRVQTARGDLRCDVCRKVLEETVSEVLPKPKSLRSEHDLLTIMEKICEGGPDLSIPNYFGVEPPPLPAKWTDRWRPKLDKKLNRYVLKAMPKKSRQKRDKWRSLANEGKQQPPDPDDAEQDTMLTLTCKDIVEPERFSELLFREMGACQAGSRCTAASRTAMQAVFKTSPSALLNLMLDFL